MYAQVRLCPIALTKWSVIINDEAVVFVPSRAAIAHVDFVWKLFVHSR